MLNSQDKSNLSKIRLEHAINDLEAAKDLLNTEKI